MKPLLYALAAIVALVSLPLRADDPVVPSAGFKADRYEVLWKKSPFAVATADAASQDTSPDYTLVGIASFDGISYGSVVETKPPQEHFLISTDRPTRGLTLTSISVGHNGGDTYATVMKDGQPITLKLEQTADTGGPGIQPASPFLNAPGTVNQQIPMPGTFNQQIPMPNFPGSVRPFTRFHRLPIHLPPINTQQQPPPAPPPHQ